MMGASNLPPAELVRDLRALLELLQLAADPKKSKAVLDKIDDAHAEIAGKTAELEAREKAAVALEERAEKAVAKQEAATNKAITEQANLASMKQALTADQEAFSAEKSAADVAMAERGAALDQAWKEIEAQRVALAESQKKLDAKLAAVDIRLADLESIKAGLQTKESDLNERINKLRALAE